MNLSDKLPFLFVLAFIVLGGGIFLSQFVLSDGDGESVKVTVPKFSQTAISGQQAFEENCARCHGKTAGGSDKGPPLVHNLYNTGHHADQSFVFAIKRGARQHHWGFGSMPARPKVSDDDIPRIIRFVRELQSANGVF